MELDDMKAAWKTLDERMSTQAALNFHLFKEGKLDRMKRGLRPLVVGQVLQILFGIALALLGGSFWTDHTGVPHLLIAGLVVHLYGVLTIVCGGVTLGFIARIDHAAPVLAIQQQLAKLRRFYVRTGLGLGLAWWFLWIPVLMVLIGDAGVDLYNHAPSVIWSGIATGVAGLLLTWVFHRWSRHPSRPNMARAVDENLAGSSLTKAQRFLDEIAQFEKE
jgi:serine/threonine-protein kinase